MIDFTSPTRRQVLTSGLGFAVLAAGGPVRARQGGRELRIGHQKGVLSLLKGRGTLEKRLAPLGVSLQWTEFTAGPVQLEALNVGSIDFGDVGEAPPIFAQAAGAPLVQREGRLLFTPADTPGSDWPALYLRLAEAEHLLDALPANLAQDDRALRARARLGFAALLKDAPPAPVLEAAIAADPADLRARHLLGVRLIVAGDAAAAMDQFLEMLRRDRGFEDGLPRKALIDAFRVVEDEDLVGTYRRKMASLLF